MSISWTFGWQGLIDAVNIWFTNVVVFALWFWNLDGGGPAVRAVKTQVERDFMFPQMATNLPGQENWAPGFIDYLFVSFDRIGRGARGKHSRLAEPRDRAHTIRSNVFNSITPIDHGVTWNFARSTISSPSLKKER